MIQKQKCHDTSDYHAVMNWQPRKHQLQYQAVMLATKPTHSTLLLEQQPTRDCQQDAVARC
jgi:hypothetical protein